MTRTEEQITLLLQPDGTPERKLAAARDLISRYPCFLLPAIVALKECRGMLNEKEVKELTLKVALSDPSHAALFDLMSTRAEEFRHFYPEDETPSRPTTEDAIDTFLQRYGGGKNNAEETELLERLIFNPVPDYASVLEQQEAADPHPTTEPLPDSADARIDEFIRKHSPERPEDTPVAVEQPRVTHIPDPSPDSLLSESLAKFHIRRRQYDKALEIIRNLMVSHPAKADQYEAQIRFLKKLIRNRELTENN